MARKVAECLQDQPLPTTQREKREEGKEEEGGQVKAEGEVEGGAEWME